MWIHVQILNHNCPLLQTICLLTFQVTMLQERASLQRQPDESQTGTSVAVGTPRRVRSMAVGTSDYNMAAGTVVSAPETVVEKVYNSSTLVRLQNKNVSPRRNVKQRQTRSDKVKTDLVIPSDLIQKRYSDSCSNLSVMVTVTRKRSEQGQGDGPDFDECRTSVSDEGARSNCVLAGRGKVSRKEENEDKGWTDIPGVGIDEDKKEVRGFYPRQESSREMGVGIDQECQNEGTVNERDIRGRYPRITDREKGVGFDEECQFERREDPLMVSKEDPLMVSFTCQTEEDLGRVETK